MSDLRRVHRFRDHAVAGVNWRPTRFVDEVPSLRVCCLCRMIPKTVLALPCGHLLCQSCLAASSHGSGGRCPLDRKPFKEAECSTCDLTTRSVNALKVHCWNDGQGCKFEGAMEIMLRHYENECTFHTVECFRCGEQVLHSELPAHYAAGCSAAVSLACPKNTSSDSQAFTLRDVTGALAELKALLRGANQELLLPVIESRMNELTERIRNLESMSAVITRAARAAVTSDLVRVAAPSPSASQIKETSRQTATEEAGASSTSRSCSGENLKPPQLEPLVGLPQEVLEAMRKTTSQDYPRHVFTDDDPDIRLELVGLLPTALSWREVLRTVKYVLTFRKFLNFISTYVTVLHARDAYFTLFAEGTREGLRADITFHGMRGDSQCVPPVFCVKTYSWLTGEIVPLSATEERCDCEHDRDLWTHRRRTYYLYIYNEELIPTRDTEIKLEIELYRP
uniref:Putative tnf receptor-associated factor 6 ovary overexpressed n=1 Tax=Rhipicephalus microplus TaxID=6941 RepID=A0A6M2D5J5_RHIMP